MNPRAWGVAAMVCALMVWTGCHTASAARSGTGANAFAATSGSPGSGYITAGELLRLQRAGSRVHVVDLRTQSEFEDFQLPGAVNLSPTEIKATSLWREEPVVLVGTGLAYQALTRMRLQLLDQGFASVRILDGGVAHWRRAVAGEAAAASQTFVDAKALDLHGDASRWVLVDLDGKAPEGLPTAATYVQGVGRTPEQIEGVVRGLLERKARVRNVLFVGSDRAQLWRAARVLAATAPANVFALEDGWREWTRTERQRSVQQANRENAGLSLGPQCW